MFDGGRFPHRKRVVLVHPRRSGKDTLACNVLAIASQMQVGTYFHMLPSTEQARKVVFSGIGKDGRRLIDQAYPMEMRQSTNETSMTIKMLNGSVVQMVGSDNYDSLVGTNPLGVVFSEFALADSAAWDYLRPVLVDNGGFAIFISTPRGKNHLYDMYRMAQLDASWYASRLTVEDIVDEDGARVVSEALIEQERKEGVADELIEQEFYCSFEGVNRGSIYGKQLDRLEEAGHMLEFDYNPEYSVYTAWDLGWSDDTSVWFFQIIAGEIRIIDFYTDHGLELDDWFDRLKETGYALGTPLLPHDAKAKTLATKLTIFQQFLNQGLRPAPVPNMGLLQGIAHTRAILNRVWFNTGNERVRDGLECMREYRYEWDAKKKAFRSNPLHDLNSHPADAFRMLALGIAAVEPGAVSLITKKVNPVVAAVRMQLDSLFADRDERRQRAGMERI